MLLLLLTKGYMVALFGVLKQERAPCQDVPGLWMMADMGRSTWHDLHRF